MVTSLEVCATCKHEWQALTERRLDEHRIIGELDKLPDARYHMVPANWLNQWLKFIRNDQGPLGRGTWRGALPPGQLDWSVLRDADNKPKPNLKEKTHYTLVSEKIYDTWKEWYGCSGEPMTLDAHDDIS